MALSKKPRRPRSLVKQKLSARMARHFDQGAVADFLAKLPGPPDHEALNEAQGLVYDAWEERTPTNRVAMAKKALSLSPLCADAWVLLGGLASTPIEALDCYQRGVVSGAAAIGEVGFEDYAGHFWGFLETRPYMRARAGLAETLWALGRHTDAINHLEAMLELNPGDNQGLRYVLASHLLELDNMPALQALLDEHEDASALWLYTGALVAFKTGAPTADEFAKEAFEANPHVPLLLARKKVAVEVGPFITWGGEDEAALYVAENRAGWEGAPRAIDWLLEITPSTAAKEPAKRGGK